MATFQYKGKEIVEFESSLHSDFKKRYNATIQEQYRSRLPVKLIVVIITLALCSINVIWGYSSKSSEVAAPIPAAVVLSKSNLTKTLPKIPSLEKQNAHKVAATNAPMTTKAKLAAKMPPASHQRLVDNDLLVTTQKFPRPNMIHSQDQTIPVYYVNLDSAPERRQYIEKHLEDNHLRAVHVSALSTLENVTVSIVSPLSLVNPNNKETACIASHMIAIHKAVNDHSFFPSSPFAIIIEDDVKFEFPVNWNELLYNAPEDFDVLQLMTSNAETVNKFADSYETTVRDIVTKAGKTKKTVNVDLMKHSHLWNARVRTSNAWSTQAYAIRKDNIRDLINARVKRNDVSGEYYVNIKNTHNQLANCKQGNAHTCKLLYPFRIVADVYLYDLLGVAYTLRLPLLNGALGFNTSIQTNLSDEGANNAFRNFSSVVDRVRRNSDRLLPQGLLLKT